MQKKNQPNIVLFVGNISERSAKAVVRLSKEMNRRLRIVVLIDTRQRQLLSTAPQKHSVLICDTSKPEKVADAIEPYRDQLLLATCMGEKYIPIYTNVIPHLPSQCKTPSIESLRRASDKIIMRQRFRRLYPRLTPKFTVVHDATETSVKQIVKKVGFPLIVKPAGLAESLLVTESYHEEELRQTLRRVFRKIKTVYQQYHRTEQPRVLVEQFMEGDMYSIDGYVNARGNIRFCPLVKVKTGKMIGFDDFFGYQRLAPVQLTADVIARAKAAASDATHALGLTATSLHIELMRFEHHWKVIEVGARVGGFRHELYGLAFGIDHLVNDLRVHNSQKLTIPKKRKGYTTVLTFFPKKEGVLQSIRGIKPLQKLASFKRVKVRKQIGDRCRFAKNGGTAVVDLVLCHKDRATLLADIRRAERSIVLTTKAR